MSLSFIYFCVIFSVKNFTVIIQIFVFIHINIEIITHYYLMVFSSYFYNFSTIDRFKLAIFAMQILSVNDLFSSIKFAQLHNPELAFVIIG